MPLYTVTFTEAGVPKAALTPTITARLYTDASGSQGGGAPAATELGSGAYTFDITVTKEMYVVVDGGVAQPAAERYVTFLTSPDDFALTEERITQLLSGGSHLNVRYTNHVYDDDGRLLTVNKKLYATEALYDADTPSATIAITMTYDGEGKRTSYSATV
jgi:hypothetical protein